MQKLAYVTTPSVESEMILQSQRHIRYTCATYTRSWLAYLCNILSMALSETLPPPLTLQLHAVTPGVQVGNPYTTDTRPNSSSAVSSTPDMFVRLC